MGALFWTEENLEFILRNFGKFPVEQIRVHLQGEINNRLARKAVGRKTLYMTNQITTGGIIWQAFELGLVTAEERDSLIAKHRYNQAKKTRGKGFGFSSKVKKEALARDGYRCIICGSTENLTIDHIKELWESEEKNHSLENAQTLCRKCNLRKSITKRRHKRRRAYSDEKLRTIQKTMYAQRGKCRNKPCPCGSGLKFKNCCWDKPVEIPKL